MRYSGDLSMKKLLNEYIESDKFELGKAGYIKEDGTFMRINLYVIFHNYVIFFYTKYHNLFYYSRK